MTTPTLSESLGQLALDIGCTIKTEKPELLAVVYASHPGLEDQVLLAQDIATGFLIDMLGNIFTAASKFDPNATQPEPIDWSSVTTPTEAEALAYFGTA